MGRGATAVTARSVCDLSYHFTTLAKVIAMITSIEINNFRCFKRTIINDFQRVNLFGGRNNAGKTSLLEALYLSRSPRSETVMLLRRLRKEEIEFAKSLPDKTWDNLFYDQKSSEEIVITITNNKSKHYVKLYCDDSIEDFATTINDEEDESSLQELNDLLAGRDRVRKTLHIHSGSEQEKSFPVASIIAHPKGIAGRDMTIPDFKRVSFIPASFGLSNPALAEEYDKADLAGHEKQVLSAVQIIDSSIQQLKTLTIGRPTLYLQRDKPPFLPISMFGEAANKVIALILQIINHQGSVLLIDEIENGIHHTNQRELWELLFKLAINFDVQIFATTHSLEMLQAFADVTSRQENDGAGAYFELARNVRTGQIVGSKHKSDTLKYQLERQIGVRGE